MKILGRLLFVGFIYLSCADEKKGGHGTTSLPSPSLADTVDIPEWVADTPGMQAYFSSLMKRLNLPSLEGGSDGLQIRIWFSCVPRDTQQTMFFKQTGSVWEARFYTYQAEYKEDGSFKLYNVYSESRQPKSGWEDFARKLLQTQIKDLPDHSLLGPNYTLPTDANGLAVEVATPNKYRRYYYPEMWLNRNLAEGPAKLYSALNLIKEEFNIKTTCL